MEKMKAIIEALILRPIHLCHWKKFVPFSGSGEERNSGNDRSIDLGV